MNSSSAQHHHQEMASQQTLESMLVCTKAQQQDKKPNPAAAEQALKCPRCDSTNTKFCYYNNYSLTQPRYFCKSCRRYWTKGGTLRNVPVGGGCRKKSKRSSSSRRSSQENPLLITSNSLSNPMIRSSLSPLSSFDHHNNNNDLSLAIARLQKQTSTDHQEFNFDGNPSGNGVFDALRNGFLETPNGFYNFYYDGNLGNVENGGQEMSLPYEELNGATTVKQEICNINNVRENENMVLWGLPWQISGDSNMVDLDSGKQSWNNGFGSTWHSLLNDPLL